jgi:hypothetical protein
MAGAIKYRQQIRQQQHDQHNQQQISGNAQILGFSGSNHDPEKWISVFPKKIMLKQRDKAGRRFEEKSSRFCLRARPISH